MMFRARRIAAGLCLLSTALLPLPLAAVTGSTFLVSATVAAGCLVVGGVTNYGSLNFGTSPALATSVMTATLVGGVQLQCTPGVTLNMTVNGGQYSTTTRNLQLNGGSARVAYQLFRDVALTQSLGISQSVAVAYSDANNISLPVYGRLQLPGNTPAGQYSDVVQVQLSW